MSCNRVGRRAVGRCGGTAAVRAGRRGARHAGQSRPDDPGVPCCRPHRRGGDLPADRDGPGDRGALLALWPGRAGGTCTVSPTPRWGGGWPCSGGGCSAASWWPGSCPRCGWRFAYSSEVTGTIVAAGLLVLVGALDDRFELDAITKLAGQATDARRAGALRLSVGGVLGDPGAAAPTCRSARAERAAHRVVVGRAGERDELRRRAGRASPPAYGLGGRVGDLAVLPRAAVRGGQRPERLHPALIAALLAGPASASCRTTSTRRGSSWATPGRC